MKKIYLDNNATTQVHPEVLDAMLPYLKNEFCTLARSNRALRKTEESMDVEQASVEAKKKVAKLLNCDASEIFFTSCGSEGNNLAIKGIVEANRDKGNHIITTKAEHASVLNVCKYLAKIGFDVTYLNVDNRGLLDLDQFEAAITEKTILISIMYANNETGVIFPIEEISKIARKYNIAFHVDAVQGAGKIALDVKKLNVDLLTLSGHKLYAPKGVGAIYIRNGTSLIPLIHGCSAKRDGIENIAGIVAMGKACEIALRDMDEEITRITDLRDRLERGLIERIPYARLNGHPARRISNTVNLSFEFVDCESLLLNLDLKGIAVSSGSVYDSGISEPSHVLMSMGLPADIAHGSVIFSFGRGNTLSDVEYVIEVLPSIIEKLRKMSPFYSKLG